MKYYLVGINGSGMYALNNILKDEGYDVLGYDINDKEIEINNEYTYIISNAYINNDLVKYLYNNNYKCYLYHEFIAMHFNDYRFICISGSHGKTTTTSFLKQILTSYSYICGDKTSRLGTKTLILESCEYKESFLSYTPDILVILSLDYDHPDYYKNNEEYINAYVKLANKSKIVILNNDDINASKIKHKNIITFGFNKNSDYVIDYKIQNNKMIVTVNNDTFILNHIGKHIAYDFVASFIVSTLEKVSRSEIKNKANLLNLPKRRLQTYKIKHKVLISDYAHHPSELKYLFDTLNNLYDTNKLLLIFEPHTYTRFNAFKEDFYEVLHLFKNVLITNIYYPIREQKNKELEDKLYEYINIDLLNENDISKYINDYDVIVFCGAGEVEKILNRCIDIISNVYK